MTDSATSYPVDANLYALCRANADASPSAVAVVSELGTTTYSALLSRADVIAWHLSQHEIRSEEPVGIFMARTPDMLAAMLAVLRVGGAYVPLDPDDPIARNQIILQSAGCRIVLCHAPTIASLDAAVAPVRLDVDALVAQPDPEIMLAPVAAGGSRLAYILHTSGSTGRPKGVEVEHASVINLLFGARELLGFTGADRYLATATIGFDISVAELFMPLAFGASLLLRDRYLWTDPAALAADVRRHGVTVVQTGPSAWSTALSEVPDFPRVRVVISTGEAIPVALAQRLASHGEDAWNLYGPTEATIWATAQRLSPALRDATGVAAIGAPLPNVTACVLDERGEAPPGGNSGELCLGGVCLARGYRGQPELTRERFITHGSPGRRLYRTGDVVALSEDGALSYLGRNDDQLKVRGVRIEPAEVEAALLAHPLVREVVVTWFENVAPQRSIVAAVVAVPGAALDVEDLRRWLEPRLPAQMIPARFSLFDVIPTAPSGKVDRNAIRSRMEATSLPQRAGVSALRALTSTERDLAAIWHDILGAEIVAPDAHFFSFGGDSLAAVRVMSAVASAFGTSLPVQTVFEAPTLSQLAARIDRARAATRSGGRSPVTPPEASFIFPLSEGNGERPLFFSAVDLKMARRGAWQVPCSLYAVAYWAQGQGFIKARSIAELARVGVVGIRRIQPNGPYRIAGYSFGGLVAIEIAQQLQRQGEVVELLFLLDPMRPGAGVKRGASRVEALPGKAESLPEWIRRHVDAIARRPLRLPDYIAPRVRNWLLYHVMHWHGRKPNPVSTAFLPRARWPAFWYVARRMMRDYAVRPYSGKVLAIFSRPGKRVGVWSQALGADADIQVLPAKHDSYFDEPALSEWTARLARHLPA